MEGVLLRLTINEIQKCETDMLRDVITVCEEFDISYYAIYGTLLATIRHKGPIPWDPDVDLYVPDNDIKRLIELLENKMGDKYWVDYRNDYLTPRPFPRIGLKGYETEILHIDIFRMSGLPNGVIEQKIFTGFGRLLYVIWRAKTVNPQITYHNNIKKMISSYLIQFLSFPFSLSIIIKLIDGMCRKYPVFSTNYVGRAMGVGAIYVKSLFYEYTRKSYCDFFIRVPIGYEKLLKIMYGDYMKYPPQEYRDKQMNTVFVVNSIKK